MLFLAAALALPQGADVFARDVRFAKPVTIQASIVPVSEVLAEVSRQIGVRVGCAPVMNERKLTIFVDARPAGELLSKIATLTRWEWKAEGEDWRLSLPAKVTQDEATVRDAERRLENEAMTAEIQSWIRVSSQPFEDLKTTVEDLEAKLKALPTDAQAERERLTKERDWLKPFIDRPARYHAGRFMRGITDAEWRRLFAGEPLFASTKPGRVFRPLSREAINKSMVANDDQKLEKEAYLVGLHDPIRNRLRFNITSYGSVNGATMVTYYDYVEPSPPQSVPEDRLAGQPLIKWLRAWRKVEDDPRPVEPGAVPPTNYYGGVYTAADHLEFLAKQGKVSIVADAYRVWHPSRNFSKGRTVGDWARELAREGGNVRLEDGWLLFRTGRYWRYLDSEIPERLLRSVEAKAANEPLTADDYAAFARSISPIQQRRFRQIFSVPVRFYPTPLYEAFPALEFWGLLTPALKQRVLKPEELPVSQLTPELRTAFFAAIQESVAFSAGGNERMLRIIAGERDPELESKFTFRFTPMSSMNTHYRTHSAYPPARRTGEPKIENGCVFHFGVKDGASANYSTTLPTTKWTGPAALGN